MKNASFAMKAQTVLICLLLLAFVLMAQTADQNVFIFGAVMILVCSLCQIAVGNIDASYGFPRWIKALGKISLIIAGVVGVSMLIIPLFLDKEFVRFFLWALIFGTVSLFTLFIYRGTKKKAR